jgi:hypothetical protein
VAKIVPAVFCRRVGLPDNVSLSVFVQWIVAILVMGLVSEVQAASSVVATVHPSQQIELGKPVRVSFGFPLTSGALDDPGLLHLTGPSDEETPIAVRPLLRWTDSSTGRVLKSWRAVLVQFDWTFADLKPQQFKLEWGGRNSRQFADAAQPRKDWVLVSDREYPAAAGVHEPRTYVTLPAEYLAEAGIFPPSIPLAGPRQAGDFAYIDDAQVRYFDTATNDVGPGIQQAELIPYLSDAEPWLYDRAAVFFRTYVRSGRVEHLRAAHRAAAFYVNHLDNEGFFDLKPGRDAKYSYAESLLADLILFGDTGLVSRIEDVARATRQVRLAYTTPQQFWTERHVAYRLLNAIVAFEATGKAAFNQQAKQDIASLLAMLAAPPAFIPSRLRHEGCFVHTALSHGEGDENEYVCSPWMSVLLVMAFQRYDWRGADKQIGQSVMSLADYVLGPGSRIENKWIDGHRPSNARIPYYLATQDKVMEDDPWADKEHALDVSKVTAVAYHYAQRSGDKRAGKYRAGTLEFIVSARKNLEQWYRPNGPREGKPVYRLTPSRKYNWWFQAYHDVEYLLEQDR